jgi:flagellar FliJ protein
MGRFVFTLQPVLAHRERIESERQVVFAAAAARLRDEEEIRAEFVARREAMRLRLRTRHHEMDADELRASYAHCDFLDRAILAQSVVVQEARGVVEAERARLIDATKDKKILETLKDHRREAFDVEAAALEQRETDDINARRFDRDHATRETAPT